MSLPVQTMLDTSFQKTFYIVSYNVVECDRDKSGTSELSETALAVCQGKLVYAIIGANGQLQWGLYHCIGSCITCLFVFSSGHDQKTPGVNSAVQCAV